MDTAPRRLTGAKDGAEVYVVSDRSAPHTHGYHTRCGADRPVLLSHYCRAGATDGGSTYAERTVRAACPLVATIPYLSRDLLYAQMCALDCTNGVQVGTISNRSEDDDRSRR